MPPKVGIVGCGGIGNTHARQYTIHKDAELRCFCDIDKARADKAAKQFNVKAYYSIADMVKNEELDSLSASATAGPGERRPSLRANHSMPRSQSPCV